MRHKNYRVWLRGCKLRTWKKHYGSIIWVDGVGYTIKQYNELINQHKKIKVGDDIYNPYLDTMNKVIKVNYNWKWSDKKRNNFRRLVITFITSTNHVVYDLNDILYCKKEFENV